MKNRDHNKSTLTHRALKNCLQYNWNSVKLEPKAKKVVLSHMSQSKYQCLKSIVVTMVCNNHNIFGERSYLFSTLRLSTCIYTPQNIATLLKYMIQVSSCKTCPKSVAFTHQKYDGLQPILPHLNAEFAITAKTVLAASGSEE